MIELSNISVNYKRKHILKDINLKIEKGDFTILFGGEQIERSSIAGIIMGLETAYKGRISVFSKYPETNTSYIKSAIRFCPDTIIWEENLTVEDFFFRNMDLCSHYATTLLDKMCRKYKIPMQEQLLDLTYQQNKLVQIIDAVCSGPRLLILDTPFNNLDASIYRQMLADLVKLNQVGMTILLLAESFSDGGEYCSNYSYMRNGITISAGKVSRELFETKIVTVYGGHLDILANDMKKCLRKDNKSGCYLFEGKPRELLGILYNSECQDYTVENIPLEELLDQNFTRWE